MFDLGALFNSQQPAMPAAPDPALKSEWDGWLQNPANKAGLLSFGLQLMTGGWGGPGSQLAKAIGSGVESAVGTQKMIDTEVNQERARADVLDEKEKERQLRRDLNKEDNEAAMSRTKAGAGSAREQAIFASLVNAAETRKLKLLEKVSALQADTIMLPEEKQAALAPLQKELDSLDPVGYAESVMARRGFASEGAIAGPETSGISAPLDGAEGDSVEGKPAPVKRALKADELLSGLTEEKRAQYEAMTGEQKAAFLAKLQTQLMQSATQGRRSLLPQQPQGSNAVSNWLLQNLPGTSELLGLGE